MLNPLLLFFFSLVFKSLIVEPPTPFHRFKLFIDIPAIVPIFEELRCALNSLLVEILHSTTPPTIKISKSFPVYQSMMTSGKDTEMCISR